MLSFLIHLLCSTAHAEEYTHPQSHVDAFIDTIANKQRWDDFTSNPQNEWVKRNQAPKIDWFAQKDISQKDIHFLNSHRLHILPNIVPSAQDMSRLLQKRSLATGQIPQKVMEGCDKNIAFPSSVLYTTGSYEINKELLHCTQNVGFYPTLVSKVTTPLNKKNAKRLFEVTIENSIDADSIQNLISYHGSVTILSKKVPKWLLENIEAVEWRALNLPNISKTNTKILERLALFRGNTLRLNGLQKLSPKESKALAAFPVQRDKKGRFSLELKGLSSLSPKALKKLSAPGRAHLILSLENATEKHFAALQSRKITMVGLKEISLEMADALNDFRGSLLLPDLESISSDVYLSLINVDRSALEKEKSGAWYTARNKRRKMMILDEIMPVTKEWVALRKDLHILQGSSSNPYGMLKQWIELAKKVDTEGLKAAQEKDKRFRGRPFSIDSLNGITTLSPELAQFCAQQKGLHSLGGLQSIDNQSLSILVHSPAPLSLNGLTTLSMDQAKIIAERASQVQPNIIHLKGITHIEDDVLKVLSELSYVALPHWTLQHVFPSNFLKNKEYSSFDIFSPERFAQLDFTDSERINLESVPNVTPEHIEHLSKYPIKTLYLHAWSLQPETIQHLIQWPHEQTEINIKVNDAPIEALVELTSMNVDSLEFNMIHANKLDLSFLQDSKTKEVELFFDWMPIPIKLNTLHPIKTTKLTISARQNTSFDATSIRSILENFEGSQLNITAGTELTPALARSIMSRTYNLSIHIEGFQDDKENEILSILQTPSKHTRPSIEGDLPICGEEYRHIRNEQCDIAEEMQRSQEYWENHDCIEEGHEDHE